METRFFHKNLTFPEIGTNLPNSMCILIILEPVKY